MRRSSRARSRSLVDVLLLVVAVILLVVVGYGIINRDALIPPATTATVDKAVDTDSTSEIAAAPDESGEAAFGWTGEGEAPDNAAVGSDEAATLEQVEAPQELAPSWNLDGTFASVNSGSSMYVNVRTGPSLDYRVIRSVPPRTIVQIVRRNDRGDWIRVKLETGEEGWIFGELLLFPD